MYAETVVDSELELKSERFVELFIILALVFEHFFKLGFNLLFKILCNDFEKMILLKRLARNVQREIG